MVQRVSTVAFEGIEARSVDVQVQVAPGLPAFANADCQCQTDLPCPWRLIAWRVFRSEKPKRRPGFHSVKFLSAQGTRPADCMLGSALLNPAD